MGNRLKKIFSNQEILYKGKISFKNKDSYDEFIEALNSVQKEGKVIKLNGIKDIKTTIQNGEDNYPISGGEEIIDVVIGPSKEIVTFNIDTKPEKKKITFSRFHTEDNIILETDAKSIVYLKIIFKKGTMQSKITYRVQPEKAESIEDIIEYYDKIIAFFDILFEVPVENMSDDIDTKDLDSIKLIKNYFNKSILLWKKLRFLEKEFEITVDPLKLHQDSERCWREVEQLYIIIKDKKVIRVDIKLIDVTGNNLNIDQQEKNIKVGTVLDITFIEKKKFDLWGNIIELYMANFLTNAVVQEITELEDEKIKISYGQEDSRPMFISYRGFKTLPEAEREMKNIMKHKNEYINAKKIEDYISENLTNK